MSFRVSWSTLVEELDALPEGATLRTPLSHKRFRIAEVQEHRVIIEFLDREHDETRPLQRDQFETLYRRITDEPNGFELDRLPPDADPYPTVLSVHPRFEIDEDRGVNYPALPRSGLPAPRLLRTGLPVSVSELIPGGTGIPDSAGDFPSRVVRSVPLLPH